MENTFVNVLEEELEAVTRKLAEVRIEAEKVKSEMIERLAALEEKRGQFETRIRHIQALLALDGVPITSHLQVSSSPSGLSIANHETLGGTLANEVHSFLAEKGKEYHYRDLIKALQERGINVPGKDPANNLVAHIYKDARFVRPKRGVYALKEWYPASFKSTGKRKNRSKRAGNKATTPSRR